MHFDLQVKNENEVHDKSVTEWGMPKLRSFTDMRFNRGLREHTFMIHVSPQPGIRCKKKKKRVFSQYDQILFLNCPSI